MTPGQAMSDEQTICTLHGKVDCSHCELIQRHLNKLPPAASPDPQNEGLRCVHGVWVEKHCYLCAKTTLPPSQPRAVELPPLHNMPNLERRYGRFTEDSIERYDKARLQQREAELQTALELLREIQGEHDRLNRYKKCACWSCSRLDQSKLLEGK